MVHPCSQLLLLFFCFVCKGLTTTGHFNLYYGSGQHCNNATNLPFFTLLLSTFAVQTHLVMASHVWSTLPHFSDPVLAFAGSHLNSSRPFPQFDSAVEGPKCCLTSASISSVRPWPCAGQAEEKGDSASPHLFLAASVCLSYFHFLTLQPKFWWQIVFPWVTQRGDAHSCTFIPVGHVLYSNEPGTELFCRMHPKI